MMLWGGGHDRYSVCFVFYLLGEYNIWNKSLSMK